MAPFIFYFYFLLFHYPRLSAHSGGAGDEGEKVTDWVLDRAVSRLRRGFEGLASVCVRACVPCVRAVCCAALCCICRCGACAKRQFARVFVVYLFTFLVVVSLAAFVD